MDNITKQHGPYAIATVSAPDGFFSYLLVTQMVDGKVDKVYPSSFVDGWFNLASCPRAKFSNSEPESHNLLRKNVAKEIASLEKKVDLRPSQVKRMELLKGFLSTKTQ